MDKHSGPFKKHEMSDEMTGQVSLAKNNTSQMLLMLLHQKYHTNNKCLLINITQLRSSTCCDVRSRNNSKNEILAMHNLTPRVELSSLLKPLSSSLPNFFLASSEEPWAIEPPASPRDIAQDGVSWQPRPKR